MTPTLTQRQRLLAAAIYLALLWTLYHWFLTHVPGSEPHAVFWAASGALMIVLGAYVVEPFFTTPADAIVNSLALLIALLTLPAADQRSLLGFHVLLVYCYSIIGIAVAAIALKDSHHWLATVLARLFYAVSERLGKSKVLFSAPYLLASYCFFARPGQIGLFISALTLWMCIVFFDVAGNTIAELAKVIRWMRKRPSEAIGVAIGCDNPLQYTVEVDHSVYKGPEPQFGDLVAIETTLNVGSVGMVVNRNELYRQPPGGRLSVTTAMVIVRCTQAPSAIAPYLRTATRELGGASLVVDDVRTLEELRSTSLGRPRLYAVLLAMLAFCATTIAGVGLFAVMTYNVTSRSREIGVRGALGARPLDIARHVVVDALRLSVSGLVVGMLAALASVRALASFLYGVSAYDGITFALVPLSVLAVAILACLLPAQRAAQLDPAQTLRCR